MPLPIMVPTTIALAWLTPSSRKSVGAVEVESAVCAISLRRATIAADWNYKRLPRSGSLQLNRPDNTLLISGKRLTEVIVFLLPCLCSRDVAISHIHLENNPMPTAITQKAVTRTLVEIPKATGNIKKMEFRLPRLELRHAPS